MSCAHIKRVIRHLGLRSSYSTQIPITHTKLFINGHFIDSLSGATFETINPTTGKPIALVSEANKNDVDFAVQSADNAYRISWKHKNPTERSKLMHKWADLIERDSDYIAKLETLDSGKPIRLSKVDAYSTNQTKKCF